MMLADVTRLLSQSRNRLLPNFAVFQDLENWWTYHSSIVNENWHFYLGQHNLFLKRWEKEDEGDFLKRVEDATIENHIAPVIDVVCAYLYGEPDKIKRYVNRGDDLDAKLTDVLKKYVWRRNVGGNFDDVKALNTLVTGYTVIQRQFLDVRTGQPMIFVKPQEIEKYGFLQKRPIDSEYCAPLPYYAEDGSIDPRRLGAILYVAEYDNFVGNKTIMSLLGRPRRKISVIEYVDDQVWLKWQKNQGENTYNQIPTFPGTPWENRNPYESVSIPFTVYRNTGDPFYIEGDSDVPDLKSLNMELNELANGDKDTIRYHQDPILVGLNGAKLPNDFRRTRNAVIELDKKDASFEYLTWEGTLDPSQKRQDEIRRAMTNVSGVSLISRGFMRDIGQIRSGPPLKALFTSDRALMARKFSQFRACEAEDMWADLQMIEKQAKMDLDIDTDVTCHIIFNPDFIGIDRLLEEEIKSLQIQSGSVSIEEALRDEHPDWSEDQIEEEVRRIVQQRLQRVGGVRKSVDSKALEQVGNDGQK